MKYIKFLKLAIAAVFLPLSYGCSVKIYKPDLRQGNYIEPHLVKKLKTNLTKEQVKELLGSPAIIPALNKGVWIYSYYFIPGDSNEPNKKVKKDLVLFFHLDKLQAYQGDWDIPSLARKA